MASFDHSTKSAAAPSNGMELHYHHLLQQKDARVKELEVELKEARKTIGLLSETVRNISAKQSKTPAVSHKDVQLENRVDQLKEKINEMNHCMQNQCNLLQMTLEYVDANEKEMKKKMEELAIRVEGIKKMVTLPMEKEDSNKWSGKHDNLGDLRSIEEALQKKVFSLLNGWIFLFSISTRISLSDLEVLKQRIQIKNSEIVFENGASFKFDGFEQMIQKYREAVKDPNKFQYALSVLQNPLWILAPDDYELSCFNCKELVPMTSVYEEDGHIAKCPSCHTWICLGKAKDGLEWVYARSCDHFQQVNKGQKPNHCIVCRRFEPNFHSSFYEKQIDTPLRKKI